LAASTDEFAQRDGAGKQLVIGYGNFLLTQPDATSAREAATDDLNGLGADI